MMNKNIFTFIGCESNYEDASVVLFGAPFDGTTSFRPGTRFASEYIRKDSFGLETYSPYQDKDLEDLNIFDGGDLYFPYGNTRKVLDIIRDYTKRVLKDGKKPFMIGGEHLVTLPVIESLSDIYKDLHIIHFDAHTDLRDDYEGEKLSHATVIKRAHDIVGDGKIFQFGIRSGLKKEFIWAKEHTFLNKFDFTGLAEVIEKIKDKPVYITIDLDILDPSIFPGTGTPEAGGVSFKELMEAILKISKLENIVGADIVELSPHYDQSGASTAVACKVLRELVLAIQK